MNQDFGAIDPAGAVPAVLLSQPAVSDAQANPELAAWETAQIEQIADGTVQRAPVGPGGSISGCSWAGGGGWDDCDT